MPYLYVSRFTFYVPPRFTFYMPAPKRRRPEETRGHRMSTDPLTLRRIDNVRFVVGNARQSAYFYRNAFGFDVVAYGGLETGIRDEAGYVLRQGEITFVLSSP